MAQKDKFGIPQFHPTKAGGFVYESSDDPVKDDPFESGSETKTSGNNEVTMKPNGPTNFHLGKNARGFKDETGGCGKHFKDWEGKGYAYKSDDVRDIELKGVFYFNIGSNGFSISACTGHHSGSNCCQGHAYMLTMEPSSGNARFRKEMWHVSYHDSPGGDFDFNVSSGNWVGVGFCRYNVPGSSGQVAVEAWICEDPDNNLDKWVMIKKEVDKPGYGWGNDGDDCGGDKDQVITWSGPKNRFKTNASSGSVKAKMLSMREIDINATDGGGGGGDGDPGGHPPGEPPPPPTAGTISRDWSIKYNIIAFGDDACGVGINADTTKEIYNVTDNGSSSNLHRDRYRCCMFANGSASILIGKMPKRVKIWLSKSGSPPAGGITVVLRKDNDDTVAVTYNYVGAANLDALDLTTTKTQYVFENLTANYNIQNGDKICVEYSGNTVDTSNDINVFRSTLNPFDGQATCAIKFDTGGPPPTSYSAADTGRDYAWIIEEVTSATDSSSPPPPPPVITYAIMSGYDIPSETSSNLDDTRTRSGEVVKTATSLLKGKKPAYVELYLDKVGAPTGTATVTIRKGSDDSIAHTFGTIDVTTLTTTKAKYMFNTTLNTAYTLTTGDKILVEFSGGTATDYIRIGRSSTFVYDGDNSLATGYASGVYSDVTTGKDMSGVMWAQQ